MTIVYRYLKREGERKGTKKKEVQNEWALNGLFKYLLHSGKKKKKKKKKKKEARLKQNSNGMKQHAIFVFLFRIDHSQYPASRLHFLEMWGVN